MTPEEHVELLFEQVATLARALPALYALVRYLRQRSDLSSDAALAKAEELRGVEYSWRRKEARLVDEVIPTTRTDDDLGDIARDAINGDASARADLLDSWETFRNACETMDLPATAAHAPEAYLGRELQRLASSEIAWTRDGPVFEGPALRLVSDPALLAEKARQYGIDVGKLLAAKRWRMRLQRHPG